MPYKDKEKQKEYYVKNKEKILDRVSQNYRENKELKKEQRRKRYKENKNEVLLQMKLYRETNKEKVQTQTKIWHENNPDRVKEIKNNWQKNNKGKKNAQTAKRYAIKLKATTLDADLNKIKEFYILAERLTKETGVKYSVDHIKPLIKGGLHHQNNLQVISLEENIKKGSIYPYEIKDKMFFFPTGIDFITHT
jgi:16S rRNA C967 or C1407 C5-methylase (RsmB/RsmF family)